MDLEAALISWLRAETQMLPPVPLGIGDDAAIVCSNSDGQHLVTTDLLSEGVDFLLAEVEPERIGRKALAVNLSDLAAMAARPTAAFVSLLLPQEGDPLELACRLYGGMLPLAKEFKVAIAGGDTNTWSGGLAISVTALGEPTAAGVLRRSGAEVGDRLVATGGFGGSILGHHFDFVPRVQEALALANGYHVNAAMDVSDGLALDASRLAAASGCGVAIEIERVPVSAAAHRLSAQTRRSPLDHALGDGEDFELLMAMNPAEAERLLQDQPLEVAVTDIGECVAETGLWQTRGGGDLERLAPTGYQHGEGG